MIIRNTSQHNNISPSNNWNRLIQRSLASIALIFTMLTISVPTFASHIVGGELNYECLGNNRYEITLRVYRDCVNGDELAQFDNPANIGIFNGAGTSVLPVALQMFPELSGNQIVDDTLTAVLNDPCFFVPENVCVHTTVYKETVTLPFHPDGYIIAYQRCCRNMTITNITDPDDTGATYTAEISGDALNACNNGAVFDDWPPIFICVGEPLSFDHAATDNNGTDDNNNPIPPDSLVYRLCTPYTGATRTSPNPSYPSTPAPVPSTPYTLVSYEQGFDLSNVWGGNSPLAIDSNTGLITGTPQNIGQYVVGVCVDEYRDGIKISTTRRDFQYNVGQCGKITAGIGNPSAICDNLTVDFINNSQDAQNFIWNFGDPTDPTAGSTEIEPSYTFPDTGRYFITLTAEPTSECTNTITVPIDLVYNSLDTDFDYFVFRCDDEVLVTMNNTTTDPNNPNLLYSWEVSDGQTSNEENPSFLVDPNTDVSITLTAFSNFGCTEEIIKEISIRDVPFPPERETEYMCPGRSVELFPGAQNIPSLSYSWNPTNDLTDPNSINTIVSPSVTTLYTLTITSNVNPACTVDYEFNVVVGDAESATINANLLNPETNTSTDITGEDVVLTCENETVTLTVVNTTTIDSDVVWYDEDGNEVAVGPEFNPQEGGTFTVVVTDEAGCVGTQTITLQGSPVNVSIVEVENVGDGTGIIDQDGDGILDICEGETSGLTVMNNDPSTNLSYEWTGDTDVISGSLTTANPIISGAVVGVFDLVLVSTSDAGCTAENPVSIEVHAIPDVNIFTEILNNETGETETVIGQGELTICGNETAILTTSTTSTLTEDITITWTDDSGNVLDDGMTINANPDGSVTYTVTLTNALGCTTSDMITVQGGPPNIEITETVNEDEVDDGVVDINGDGTFDFCPGDSAPLNITNLDPSDDNTYQWSGDTEVLNGAFDSPSVTIVADEAPGIYTLILTSTNQYGCTREDEILIEIHEIPDVGIGVDIQNNETGETTTVTDGEVPTVCSGESAILTTTTTTNIGNDITITWTDEDGNVVGNGDGISSNPDGTVTYTVTLTNSVGCTSSSSITVQGSPIDIEIVEINDENVNDDGFTDTNGDGTYDFCFGETATLNVNNLDPNDDNTYQWSGDTQLVQSPLDGTSLTINTSQPNGVYSLILTTTNQYGCSQEDEILIEIHDIGELNLDIETTNVITGETTTMTVGNGETLTLCDQTALINITTTNTIIDMMTDIIWTDQDGEQVGFGPTIFVDPNGTVTYTGTITNEFGCSSSIEITLQGSPVQVIVEETDDTDLTDGSGLTDVDGDGILDLCIGENSALTVSNLDPNDQNTYQWSGDIQIIAGDLTSTNPTIIGNPAGVYTLILTTTNQFGCSSVIEVPIQVHEIPEIGINANSTNNETGETTTTVVENGGPLDVCSDETVTISTTTTTNIENDVTIVWTDENGNVVGNGADLPVNPDGTVTYTATYTNSAGCTNSTSVTVQGSPVNVVLAETDDTDLTDGSGLSDLDGDGILDLCIDEISALTVNNLDLNDQNTYQWSGDIDIISGDLTSTNPTIIGNPAGVYTLILTTTNQFGCSGITEVQIEVHEIPEIGIDANSTNSQTGEMTTTTIVEGGTVTVCGAEVVTITTTTTTNIENEVDIVWTDENGNVVGNGADLPVNPDGSITYTATYTNAAGCTNSRSVTVQGSPVNIQIEETDDTDLTDGSGLTDLDGDGILDLCMGQTSALTVNNLDANDQNTYEWSGDTDIISSPLNVASPDIIGTTLGVYNLTLITTNQYGCSGASFVPIEIHELPILDIDAIITSQTDETVTETISGQDEVTDCTNGLVTLTTSTTTSTDNNVTIEWLDENGNPIGTGDSVEVNPDGSVTYTAVITNLYGCSTTSEITILGGPVDVEVEQLITDIDGNGYSDLDVNADGAIDLCAGEDFMLNVVNLDASDMNTYVWTGDDSIITGSTTTQNPVLNPMPGDYTLYLETTNQYGCTKLDTVLITAIDPNASAAFTVEQDCAGYTMNFSTDNPNYEYYVWTFGDPDNPDATAVGVQNPTYTYSTHGTYEVTYLPVAGLQCDLDNQNQAVAVAESVIELAFDYEYVSCTANEVTIQFTDASSTTQGAINNWLWTFSDGTTSNEQNPIVTITQDMLLNASLTIANDNDCDGTMAQDIQVNVIEDTGIPESVVSCNNDGDVALNEDPNMDYTYAWSPGTGLSDVNIANPIANPDETTIYTVTITDNTGAGVCEITQEVEVFVPQPIGLDLSANGSESGTFVIDLEQGENTVTTCEEEVVTVTTMTTTGSAIDYDITWTDADGNAVLGNTDGTIAVNPDGSMTYTVTATDNFGCMETAQIIIQGGPVDIEIEQNVIANPNGEGNVAVINPDGSLDLCLGQEFVLNVNNLDNNDINTYTWTGDDIITAGADTGSPTVDPNGPGQYTLYLETINQYGCVKLDTVPVVVVDPNTPISFEVDPDCNGVTFNFTNTTDQNGLDYIWTFNDVDEDMIVTDNDTPSYTYSEIGNYNVNLAVDANVGCVEDAVEVIEVLSPVAIDIPDDFEADCADEAELNATINLPGWDLEWFEGDTSIGTGGTVNVTPSGPVVYTVVATNALGCTIEESLTVTGTGLDVSVEPLLYICQNDLGQISVTSNDPNDNLTYVWTGEGIISGANDATVFVDTENFAAETLTVEVSNDFGCSTTETVDYVVLTEPEIDNGQCEGLTVLFQNNSESAAYYTWDFGDGNTSTEANPEHTYAAPGDYIVTLILPDGAMCDETAFDLAVEEDPAFDVAFAPSYEDCADEAVINFSGNPTTTTQGDIVSWEWDFGTYGTSADENPTITVTDEGDVEVTVTIVTSFGCETTISEIVPVDIINLSHTIPDNLACINTETEMNPDFNPDYTYDWPGIGVEDNPTVLAEEETTYAVTITNATQGCTSVQDVLLEVPPAIDLVVSEDVNVCEETEEPITATSDQNVTITWTDDNGNVVGMGSEIMAATGVAPNPVATYYAEAIDENGCVDSGIVNVGNYEVIITLGDDEALCAGDDTQLTVNSPTNPTLDVDLVWMGGDIDGETNPSPTVSPTETTMYVVTASNDFCNTMDSIIVDVNDLDALLTDVTTDQDTLYVGNTAQLDATLGDFNYNWDGLGLNDEQINNPTATPNEAGEIEYTVTITDDNGCTSTQSLIIVVLNRLCEEPFIFFPNAFSPNDDGENDFLRLRANEDSITEMYWVVYNRWGEKVYETSDFNGRWDGTFNNEAVAPDVYGFYLRVICTDGVEFCKQGNISVLR